ncbi:hypothetical protein BDZ91DRAFT_708231 [Kalaharituber pfeilii]|nr:hypothetical protein BDZ91DRAFT_708231 [Kalaharituber pfeilii]
MSRKSLSQILLHISPPPLNVNETRDVYRAMKRYGEVEVFKVVRHVNTTFLPAPTAHVVFASEPRNLPRTITITTTPPPAPPLSPLTSTTPVFTPRNLTLTPLPSNFAHHEHVKKIFRSVAADEIRGLPEAEEEERMADQQKLTEEQREEEPGQYGRLLRLYAAKRMKSKESAPMEQDLAEWYKFAAEWMPTAGKRSQGPQAPKWLNTSRRYHTSAHHWSDDIILDADGPSGSNSSASPPQSSPESIDAAIAAISESAHFPADAMETSASVASEKESGSEAVADATAEESPSIVLESFLSLAAVEILEHAEPVPSSSECTQMTASDTVDDAPSASLELVPFSEPDKALKLLLEQPLASSTAPEIPETPESASQHELTQPPSESLGITISVENSSIVIPAEFPDSLPSQPYSTIPTIATIPTGRQDSFNYVLRSKTTPISLPDPLKLYTSLNPPAFAIPNEMASSSSDNPRNIHTTISTIAFEVQAHEAKGFLQESGIKLVLKSFRVKYDHYVYRDILPPHGRGWLLAPGRPTWQLTKRGWRPTTDERATGTNLTESESRKTHPRKMTAEHLAKRAANKKAREEKQKEYGWHLEGLGIPTEDGGLLGVRIVRKFVPRPKRGGLTLSQTHEHPTAQKPFNLTVTKELRAKIEARVEARAQARARTQSMFMANATAMVTLKDPQTTPIQPDMPVPFQGEVQTAAPIPSQPVVEAAIEELRAKIEARAKARAQARAQAKARAYAIFKANTTAITPLGTLQTTPVQPDAHAPLQNEGQTAAPVPFQPVVQSPESTPPLTAIQAPVKAIASTQAMEQSHVPTNTQARTFTPSSPHLPAPGPTETTATTPSRAPLAFPKLADPALEKADSPTIAALKARAEARARFQTNGRAYSQALAQSAMPLRDSKPLPRIRRVTYWPNTLPKAEFSTDRDANMSLVDGAQGESPATYPPTGAIEATSGASAAAPSEATEIPSTAQISPPDTAEIPEMISKTTSNIVETPPEDPISHSETVATTSEDPITITETSEPPSTISSSAPSTNPSPLSKLSDIPFTPAVRRIFPVRRIMPHDPIEEPPVRRIVSDKHHMVRPICIDRMSPAARPLIRHVGLNPLVRRVKADVVDESPEPTKLEEGEKIVPRIWMHLARDKDLVYSYPPVSVTTPGAPSFIRKVVAEKVKPTWTPQSSPVATAEATGSSETITSFSNSPSNSPPAGTAEVTGAIETVTSSSNSPSISLPGTTPDPIANPTISSPPSPPPSPHISHPRIRRVSMESHEHLEKRGFRPGRIRFVGDEDRRGGIREEENKQVKQYSELRTSEFGKLVFRGERGVVEYADEDDECGDVSENIASRSEMAESGEDKAIDATATTTPESSSERPILDRSQENYAKNFPSSLTARLSNISRLLSRG